MSKTFFWRTRKAKVTKVYLKKPNSIANNKNSININLISCIFLLDVKANL